jgi:uncharacterized protein YukE
MIDDTIQRIEARIQGAESVNGERRQELLQLLGTLKSEVAALSQTHAEEAGSIASFTDVSTHEATRVQPDPRLVELSLAGLAQSAKGFEASHPRLMQAVDAVSRALANLGI